jgi:hypothetical protein
MLARCCVGEVLIVLSCVLLQQLTEKVEIQFAECNPKRYSPADVVTLAVYVKNVSRLTVKVFEVNTTAVYADTGAEISTAMKLDGMIANEEWVVDVRQPPIQRALHNIPIPSLSLNRRGVFFVELVGNGMSARAVVRKGQLRVVERRSIAGHLLRVVDESDAAVDMSAVCVQLSSRRFTVSPDSADIVIPYLPSGQQTAKLIVTLSEPASTAADSWSFSSLVPFAHMSESYSLVAGFFVNREAIVRDNRRATVAIHPQLLLHGTIPVTLTVLTDVTLTLSSVDEEGTSSEKVFRDVQLVDGEDYSVEFPVPYGVRTVSVRAVVVVVVSGCLVVE